METELVSKLIILKIENLQGWYRCEVGLRVKIRCEVMHSVSVVFYRMPHMIYSCAVLHCYYEACWSIN
jgi:hypothetical protein